ncbi:Hypothetical predicted protein [Marmota monax]|uniref:Uncharacterized protein n=1 Tax=Marmota monax TaxID=9995 RepID=A0A5E4C3K6_MARMO|nr:Hypothetical predicted protein [Marmota monax]
MVPTLPSFGESLLSPMNMDMQELIKAEPKQLLNNIAASKCPKGKLEHLSPGGESEELKSQNTELASSRSLLPKQVAQLKQKVLSHVNSSCQLLPQY